MLVTRDQLSYQARDSCTVQMCRFRYSREPALVQCFCVMNSSLVVITIFFLRTAMPMFAMNQCIGLQDSMLPWKTRDSVC